MEQGEEEREDEEKGKKEREGEEEEKANNGGRRGERTGGEWRRGEGAGREERKGEDKRTAVYGRGHLLTAVLVLAPGCPLAGPLFPCCTEGPVGWGPCCYTIPLCYLSVLWNHPLAVKHAAALVRLNMYVCTMIHSYLSNKTYAVQYTEIFVRLIILKPVRAIYVDLFPIFLLYVSR